MKKNSLNLPLFVASDFIYEDFAEYILSTKEIHGLIRKKKYTVKSTDISYRVINHWDEKGILPTSFGDSDDAWRKFSLIEIVWLQLVKTLRTYGLSLSAIRKVRERILIWDEEDQAYPWFEYYVIKTQFSQMDGYLVVLPDGTADLAFSRQIESAKMIFGSRSYILLSLKEALESINLSTVKPEILYSLSEKEGEVLDVIRQSEVSKITLKLKQGELVSIDTSTIVSGSDLKSIKDELQQAGEYAEVIAKFEEGTEQSAEVIRKRRL